jgi:hypothetical protein
MGAAIEARKGAARRLSKQRMFERAADGFPIVEAGFAA